MKITTDRSIEDLPEHAPIRCGRCERQAIALDRAGTPLCTRHAAISITLARDMKSQLQRGISG